MLVPIVTGIILGLSAGLAPGPLLALVIAQTLRHGTREGCKIALAPLLTDTPIILAAMLLSAAVAKATFWLGILTLAGGVYVAHMAWDTFRASPPGTGADKAVPKSWLKGILTNSLSPHPWLFWLTVGATTLAKALAAGWAHAIAFLSGFYLMLVGSKIVIAIVAGRSAHLLRGRGYQGIMRTLGIVLLVFAALLIMDGAKRLAR